MSYILHIDTSSDTCTVALSREGMLLQAETHHENRNHAAVINTMIQNVLQAESRSMKDLAAVSVCNGPGSYTGLRIGLATAKGICYALSIPLIAENKLTLLAIQCNSTYNKLALIEARSGEYFVALYDQENKELLAPHLVLEPQLAALVNRFANDKITMCLWGCNNNMTFHDEILDEMGIRNTTFYDSLDLNSWTRLSFLKFSGKKTENLANITPFYLKEPYIHK